MPAKSPAQQRFFGAELGRLRAGKPTVTGLGEGKLKDFATKVKPNTPNPAMKPAIKPPGGAMGFKRRKPKKLGLPNTGVGGFSPVVKPPGMGGRY